MTSADLREIRRSRNSGAEPLGALLPARHVVTVIGIDAYASLPVLRCAVSDALGVQTLLAGMGFEAPVPPLLDGAATKAAIESLVEDQLRALLRPDDALVLFFAGHGTTRVAELERVTVETGYLVPVDARSGEHFADLIRMEDLLGKLSLLPARHILVVLDACHSGMALGAAMVGYRGAENSLRAVLTRRSRRIITSARRDEPALDTGPIPGHSLFTGALIESIRSGAADVDGDGFITLSELVVRLQQVVGQASGSRQTPDYGAFHLDDRGELVFVAKGASAAGATAAVPAQPLAAERRVAPVSRTKGILIGGASAALLAGAGALAARAWLAQEDDMIAEYMCHVGEDAMKSCRVAPAAAGSLHLRFEVDAVDATLMYDGPIELRDGRWVASLDMWFHAGPSLDQRGKGGELVLAPSLDGNRRGDWVLPGGRAVPFVLAPAAGGSASPPGSGTPPGSASALPSLDDARAAKRRALGTRSGFESARSLLSQESYLGRANEVGAPGVVCRSYAAILGAVGRALVSGGYRRDHDGAGHALDDPQCSTYVKECAAEDCCARFHCGVPRVSSGDVVKEVVRVCAHIQPSAARCEVTLVPFGAVWLLGREVRIELTEGRDVLIEGAMRSIAKVRPELGSEP